MPKQTRITLTLPHDLVEYIREIVSRGPYDTPSDFVGALVRERRRERRKIDKRFRDRLVPRNLAHLKQMIQEGIDSGPGIPAEVVMARLHAKFGAPAKQRRAARKSKH